MRKQLASPGPDDLTNIMAFVRVVQTRSFSAAARKLGSTTSAISKRVARLEDHLGTRLLSRTTRQLALTEPGTLFYERAVQILAELETAQLEVSLHSSEPRGTLRVNGPMVFGQMYLGSLLPEFLSRYPAVRLDLMLDDRYVDVLEEGYDVVIRIGRLADSGLKARKLATDYRVVCASPQYLAKHGAPQEPQDLVNHNCLRYAYLTSQNEWRFCDPQGQLFSVPVVGNLQVNHGGMMLDAVRQGLGLGFLPMFMVRKDLSQGRLQTVLDGYRLPDYAISAVYPQGRYVLPKVHAFVEFLAQRVPAVLGA